MTPRRTIFGPLFAPENTIRSMNVKRGFVYPLLALGLVAACSDGGSTERPHAGGTGGSTTTADGGAGGDSSGGGSSTGGSTDTGGNGGGTTETGGATGDTGGSPGTGGSGGSGGSVIIMPGGFSRPIGTLPNAPLPATMVGVAKADWQAGLISPTMQNRHHVNQPTVLNGYLLVNGNEEFWYYDISDPKNPQLLSQFNTPNRDPKGGPKGEGEAESHTVSFARYGDSFYEVTTSGKGVDIWNVTDPKNVVHLKSIPIAGTAYGDFTEAVWGMYWQGDTIYIGATNHGLHILDAHDPNNVTFVKSLATSALGGVSAGPLYAVGNTLVITTPKESGGIVTLDISDPLNPVTLDSVKPAKSYIGQFYGHHVFLQTPVRAWDVLTDPTNIGASPVGQITTDRSEYMSFGDGYMFLGHLRLEAGTGCAPGASKIDVSDPTKMKIVERIWGRMDNQKNDDQFTISIGNLLVMGDDQSPYEGFVIGVHQTDPDKKPPAVDTIIPKDKSTVSIKSRVGISFTDNIELATVNSASFIVRPVGGDPVAGKWGLEMGVVNFDPDVDLKPATTYEVVLPAGGITDLVGNGVAEFKTTFTTQ
jgi:Bacterial Ig-like domain